jgi:hypothetical protein
MVYELERVPDNLAVERNARARHGKPNKAGECEGNRNYDKLYVLAMK